MGRVLSVSVGPVRPVRWGRKRSSAIDKRPVEGRVHVGTLGLSGDEIADLKHHGGPDQAVYAFAREDLDEWTAELGRRVPDGGFGENLTTEGIDLRETRLGDRWAVGSTLLEVTDVRTPCAVFRGFMDEPGWVRRFAERGVSGAYLRVLQEGTVAAGDPIEVVERRTHDATLALTFRALMGEPALLPRLAVEPRASEKLRRRVDGARNDSSK